jgi:hypothetical protein
MKIQQFEKIIRKVVREEIDYALKREMDKLKKDLKKTKLVVKETTETGEMPIEDVEDFRAKLREQMPPPNFNTGDNTLNSLLSETAHSPSPEQVFNNNDPVNQFVNKNWTPIMNAIEKKKEFRP